MNLNRISIFLITGLSILAVYCSLTVGMSWDEPWHHGNGLFRIEFLKSLIGKSQHHDQLNYKWAEYYPGLYDTLSVFLFNLISKVFSPKHITEIKHLINLSFSFFSLIGLFLISKKLFNKEIAYLAVVLCLLNPFFFGHLSINPKDPIIFFSLVWFAYFVLKYCENFNKKNLQYLLFASIFMGFGLGVRISFFVITIPIILSALIYLFRNLKPKINKFYKKIFIDLVIFFLISIFLMSITWPHILTGNFEVFLDSILQSISWSSGPQLGIIGGNFYETSNTPRMYLLHFFIFRLPIYLIALLITTIVILKINNQFFVQQIKNYKTSLNIVLLTFFFPIIIALFFKVKIYDGIRLFLFLIPLISLFSAMGLYYLFQNINKSVYLKIIFAIIFIFFILSLSRFLYLTPYQYTYSNFFNPKFSHTQNLYEHDYWATSFKELISKVKQTENLNNKKFSVSICGGDFWQIVSEFSKDKNFSKNITFYDYNMADKADYIIMTNRSSFITKNKTTCYSIYSGKDIIRVNRLGVDLSVFRELTK